MPSRSTVNVSFSAKFNMGLWVLFGGFCLCRNFYNSWITITVLVSTRAEYTLDDVLEDDETLERFSDEGDVRDLPEAELRVLDEDGVVVTSPGVSLASTMDRFQGPMTPGLRSSINGFYGEFRQNPGEAVVVVDEELKRFLGEEAVARFPDDDAGYAVNVRTPDQVEEVVDEYGELYAGDLSDSFRHSIRKHRIAVPALYDEDGVIDETAMALMNADGVAASDRNPEINEMLAVDLEGDYTPNSIDIRTTPAPESEEAEKYVDVLLPQNYDNVRHTTHEGDLYIQVDNTVDSQSIGDLDVGSVSENNGVYTLELE